MITLYPTFSTATMRDLRSLLLSAIGANVYSRSRAGYLRVVNGENLHLLTGLWLSLCDAIKPAADVNDTPATGTPGIAAAFIGNQPIDEQYRWSPGIRRRRFLRRT